MPESNPATSHIVVLLPGFTPMEAKNRLPSPDITMFLQKRLWSLPQHFLKIIHKVHLLYVPLLVIYSLTRNTEATPPVLAQKSMNEGYYVDGIGTSWKFMREAALDYGVIASQFDMLGEQEMADRLKDGNLIICAMGPGDFTNSGHFIVIYDYSRKKFSVNDPFSYTNSSKKWEYTTLISQCQQIWVYAV